MPVPASLLITAEVEQSLRGDFDDIISCIAYQLESNDGTSITGNPQLFLVKPSITEQQLTAAITMSRNIDILKDKVHTT